MFGIFLDFYSIYFWFFLWTGTVHSVFELSDFICSFWPICNSFLSVLYIKMFSISWTVHPPNLVILGDLFIFLRSVLVKNRKAVRILKTVNPIFQNWDSKIHRNSQKTPKMENKLCKCSGWHYLHVCSRTFIRFFF